MNAYRFRLTPVDTWFFRDGRPFEMGPLQGDAESMFPPPARTIVGALRLALARGRGYSGSGSWDAKVAAVLGDGPQNLGQLRFTGPFLALRGETLYPFPLHVVGEWKEENDEKAFVPTTFLAPGKNAVITDLGDVRLPGPKTPHVKTQSGVGLFLKQAGLEKALRGTLPGKEDVVLGERVYAFEPRIGLAREKETRTAKHGHLYRTSHLRLLAGASLVTDVVGVPEEWVKTCSKLISVGGESRMADVEITKALETSIASPVIPNSHRVTVTLLTPLRLDNAELLRGRGVFADWAGVKVVSACLGKPIFMGGWDGLKKKTLPLSPYLPAGSTWFCEMDGENQSKLEDWAKTGLGDEQKIGFGAVALGTW